MPQGFQVFGPTGTLWLDIGSRPLKLLRVDDLTEGTPASLSLPGRSAGSTLVVSTPAPAAAIAPVITSDGGSSVNIGWQGAGLGGTRRVFVMEF